MVRAQEVAPTVLHSSCPRNWLNQVSAEAVGGWVGQGSVRCLVEAGRKRGCVVGPAARHSLLIPTGGSRVIVSVGPRAGDMSDRQLVESCKNRGRLFQSLIQAAIVVRPQSFLQIQGLPP